jgi:hypothetical protein
MDIQRILSWKVVRYSIATIVLGAIGSGAWEWLLKPALAGSSEFILNLATLGAERFKNSLYEDIARGFREEPSLRLFSLVHSMVPTLLLGFIVGVLHTRRQLRRGATPLELNRESDRLAKPVVAMLLFLFAFSIVQSTQVGYINRAITHFNQVSAIAAPYMSDQERLLARSRFAQVSSSKDYADLINSLTLVCKRNGQRTPQFNVW